MLIYLWLDLNIY